MTKFFQILYSKNLEESGKKPPSGTPVDASEGVDGG